MLSRKRVENVLLEIGVPAGLKGFRYITDAVLLLDHPEWENAKLTTLYSEIGKRDGSTYYRVERAIRNAFLKVREKDGNQEAVIHYLGDSRTNANYLTTLHKVLKNECADDPIIEKIGKIEDLDELRMFIRQEIRMFFLSAAKEGGTDAERERV